MLKLLGMARLPICSYPDLNYPSSSVSSNFVMPDTSDTSNGQWPLVTRPIKRSRKDAKKYASGKECFYSNKGFKNYRALVDQFRVHLENGSLRGLNFTGCPTNQAGRNRSTGDYSSYLVPDGVCHFNTDEFVISQDGLPPTSHDALKRTQGSSILCHLKSWSILEKLVDRQRKQEVLHN
ncbi:hypothetical protein V6N11_032478 [Hibiscus sabdariffa]|uniref:Uncharacterized protein n=1 Tax=Hibiscus sabdariffa TaxID=183260 RepID=A0ABR2T1B5_9ROSI